jgi:hypothetical protein
MRDPERIQMILAAVERQWRKDPDARLGQVIVNLLRANRNVPGEDEGRVLFNVEDGQLLHWIGPEADGEENYVREEPRKAREGWPAWKQSFRESDP